VRAFFGEAFGRRQTDAGAATRDDGNLSIEFLSHDVPFVNVRAEAPYSTQNRTIRAAQPDSCQD
jgi:hypothetical protein